MHVNRQRPPNRGNPITSYGVILFTRILSENNPDAIPTLNFLLYQRRDTYEYIEFIRGNWDTLDEAKAYCGLMSAEERYRLVGYTFDELWDDFWLRRPSALKTEAVARAQNKYQQVQPFLMELLRQTSASSRSAPWGFPKGRKNVGESAFKCAIREFEEETRISRRDFRIQPCIKPVVENFVGSDNRDYATVYFVAQYEPSGRRGVDGSPSVGRPSDVVLTLDQCALPPLVPTPKGIRKLTVSNEAFRLGWFTEKQAVAALTNFRARLLQDVVLLLR